MGGDNHFVAPSDQLTRGIIGTGGIGMSGLHFASDQRCRLVAVCDVDKYHLRKALDAGVEKFDTRLQPYSDWRDLVHDANVEHCAHCHAFPLARHHGCRGRQGRQGHLL